jgi:ribosomal protein S27E
MTEEARSTRNQSDEQDGSGVPRIACGKCGKEHHIDATAQEFLGRCNDCSAFLRRPTDAERQQFLEFVTKDVEART